MAIDLGSKTLLGQERTHRVTRFTPADGSYRVLIERERVYRDGQGALIARDDVNPSADLSVAEIAASPHMATYLTACQAARSINDLIAAESVLYDGLFTDFVAANS